jgi:4-hydroxy-3-methylbut-2-enyl diphosphate reductase
MVSVEIITARRAGFCFGVKRAVDIAFKAARQCKNVFTLGPLIHNPQVIEKLGTAGVSPTDDIDNKGIGTLIIRTHGIPLELQRKLSKKKYKIIDATCPFVKKAQQYAKLLFDEGYQVVLLGDKKHPEVRGLISYAGNSAMVVNSDYHRAKFKKRVGIVVQTTQPPSLLKKFTGEIVDKIEELKVFNTICSSTALRLKETKEIAAKVDMMIVAGGKNSANTTQLANMCTATSVPTYHIETASELKEEWFENISKVGLTAGASTPSWIIHEIQERIKDIGGLGDNGYPQFGGRNKGY